MKIQQIEDKVTELASQVMSGEMLTSFLALDVKSKLVGIATLAKMANDTEVYNAAMTTLSELN